MSYGTEGWTLDDALKMIRAIAPKAMKFGYQVTLGGSVLTNGASPNDLDICFITVDRPGTSLDGLLAYLEELWGKPLPIGRGRDYGPLDDYIPRNPPQDAPMFQWQRFEVDDRTMQVAIAEFDNAVRNGRPPDQAREVIVDWLLAQEQAFLRQKNKQVPKASFTSPFAKKVRFSRGNEYEADIIDVLIVGGDKKDEKEDSERFYFSKMANVNVEAAPPAPRVRRAEPALAWELAHDAEELD